MVNIIVSNQKTVVLVTNLLKRKIDAIIGTTIIKIIILKIEMMGNKKNRCRLQLLRINQNVQNHIIDVISINPIVQMGKI